MKKLLITLASALALMVSATNVSAAPTTLSIGDGYYVGSINDGIPSNPADEAAYINFLITLAAGAGDTQIPPGTGEIYNRENSTLVGALPTADPTSFFKNDSPSNPVSTSGWVYVIAKYDAGKAGSLVWLLNGSVDSVNLPATYNGKDISHYTLFNFSAVPDGGTTAGLLGLAMMGLGYLRRRMA